MQKKDRIAEFRERVAKLEEGGGACIIVRLPVGESPIGSRAEHGSQRNSQRRNRA